MAMYTITLKEILKNTKNIGLDEYPIFDETYRVSLNKKIVNHFYNREIGTETIDMFVFMMQRKMNEIMPLYNQLYLSTKLELDPLNSMNTTTTSTTDQTGTESQKQSGTTDNTGDTSAKSRTTNAVYPQVHLQTDQDYATNGVDVVSDSTTTNNSKTDADVLTNRSDTGNVTSNTKGFLGSQSDLLTKYRSTMINIDLMVLDELEPLFMQIWSDMSEFYKHERGFYYGVL